MIRLCSLILVLASLTGCGSVLAPDPVGVGSGIDALKASPCAEKVSLRSIAGTPCRRVAQEWSI